MHFSLFIISISFFLFSQYSDFMKLCPLFRRPLGVMSLYCLLSYNKEKKKRRKKEEKKKAAH